MPYKRKTKTTKSSGTPLVGGLVGALTSSFNTGFFGGPTTTTTTTYGPKKKKKK